MQKIATKVFIISSVLFGILGILMVLTSTEPDRADTAFKIVLSRLMMSTVFVILPSFALSLAGKYLKK